MRLKNEQYEKIKEKVADIIEDYNIRYPLDIINLAHRMGFALIKYSSIEDNRSLLENMSNDGFNKYFKEISSFVIFYNESVTPITRIDQTIAHEIGHIVMEKREQDEESEAIANFFAAYLLVPTILVIENNLETAQQIKDYFKVGDWCAKNSIERALARKKCKKELLEYEKRIINIQQQ